MEEIKLKNNPLGIRVYAEGKPEMTGNEYSLLVSSFADKMDELFGARMEPCGDDKEEELWRIAK